ncbi:DUF4351 domain-containing protein [Haliea sp. E1-2-M8]|uniref:DUF4351 domain-containing protein n=1 Tax=Haliea sp. E1-2-M8 TaxID=3064706 RepID=UPI00271EDCD7|nr:DUF4351 domain-containing protein [Haliea sp. E1-2-M8]MDO8862698.1 DUF4351 domain-containing protein [Haliea sp. E1-2-M8]
MRSSITAVCRGHDYKVIETDRCRHGGRRVLQRLLMRRFGELPAWVLQKLEDASAETLETWTDDVLTASSLEELFGQ